MIGWGRKIPGAGHRRLAGGNGAAGMQAEQHQGAGLKYLTITPDGYDPALPHPLMVMLHRFGATIPGGGQHPRGGTARQLVA